MLLSDSMFSKTLSQRSVFPSITVAIPTFNERTNIRKCLNSIFDQEYPRQLLEVLVVDGGSTDGTVNIAREYGVKVLSNEGRDAEIGKIIAFHETNTDLFLFLDADQEIASTEWLKKMIYPLMQDSEIIGSFTRYFSRREDPGINRYLSYDELQRDPIYLFFSKRIKDVVKDSKDGYKICIFEKDTLPVSNIVYRTEILRKVIMHEEKFMDIDVPVLLAERGYNKYAYVPDAGLYHSHVRSLKQLIQKRMRNVEKVYLPSIEGRKFTWFKLTNLRDSLKIAVWIIYANLFFPALVKGIVKAIKYRDLACLYEPIVTIVLTNCILYSFLKHKKGRDLIKSAISTLFTISREAANLG